MKPSVEKFREMGRKGGKATGECKLRGGYEYYSRIALKGAAKKAELKARAK